MFFSEFLIEQVIQLNVQCTLLDTGIEREPTIFKCSFTWSVIDKMSFQTETDVESTEGNIVQGVSPWFKVLVCKQGSKEVGINSQGCHLGVC